MKEPTKAANDSKDYYGLAKSYGHHKSLFRKKIKRISSKLRRRFSKELVKELINEQRTNPKE